MSKTDDIKMIRNTIDAYIQDAIAFERSIPSYSEYLKEQIEVMVNKLYKMEKKERSEYENMLEKVGISKNKLIVLDVDKYIDQNILSSGNTDKKNQYNSLVELLNDKNNLKDDTIKNWIKNYKEFVVNYELDEDLMLEHMKGLFTKVGLDNKKIDEYVELYNKLQIQKPQKGNTTGSVTGDDTSKTKDVKSTEPLRIVGVTKKLKYTPTEKLATIGSIVASWSLASFTLPAVLVANLAYRLYRKNKYPKELLQKFLEENGLAIIDGGVLYDVEQGVVVSEATIEAERFKMIKEQLRELQPTPKSRFNFKYQLERFKSILAIDNKTKTETVDEEEIMTMGGR